MPSILYRALQSLEYLPELWPQFKPQHIPLLIFDGQYTWLIRSHPTEPGWQPSTGGWIWPGRHPALVANSVIELPRGLQAAGIILNTLGNLSEIKASQLAALFIHEAFHVYQKMHPSAAWQANEIAALTYPNTNAQVLHCKAEETTCLAQALAHTHHWEIHAKNALFWRHKRRMLLTAEHNQFEQRMETCEGLAEFVETRFLDCFPQLDAKAAMTLPPRQWAYQSGAALAHLLLRTGNDWQAQVLKGTPLEHLLEKRIGRSATTIIHQEFQALSKNIVQQNQEKLSYLEEHFSSLEGARLQIISRQPLSVTGFDPMNIHALNQKQVLHNRFIKIQEQDIYIELLGAPALASGSSLIHITALEIPQLSEPTIQNGLWYIQTDAVQIKLPAHIVQPHASGWQAVLE